MRLTAGSVACLKVSFLKCTFVTLLVYLCIHQPGSFDVCDAYFFRLVARGLASPSDWVRGYAKPMFLACCEGPRRGPWTASDRRWDEVLPTSNWPSQSTSDITLARPQTRARSQARPGVSKPLNCTELKDSISKMQVMRINDQNRAKAFTRDPFWVGYGPYREPHY